MATETRIHINWTRYSRIRMPVHFCPTCKTRRRMLAQFQDYYGWTETCLTCGEQWTDRQMHDRPFAPRWRKKNVARAKAAWERYRTEGVALSMTSLPS